MSGRFEAFEPGPEQAGNGAARAAAVERVFSGGEHKSGTPFGWADEHFGSVIVGAHIGRKCPLPVEKRFDAGEFDQQFASHFAT